MKDKIKESIKAGKVEPVGAAKDDKLIKIVLKGGMTFGFNDYQVEEILRMKGEGKSTDEIVSAVMLEQGERLGAEIKEEILDTLFERYNLPNSNETFLDRPSGMRLFAEAYEPKADLSKEERTIILLDKLYAEEIKPFLEMYSAAKVALCEKHGFGHSFQDSEGIVYETGLPKGRFTYYEHHGYDRTRRKGEEKGSLSIKRAKELGFENVPEYKEPKKEK